MTKVCMLAVQHVAKDDRIFYKEALSLKRHGFDVYYLHGAEQDGGIIDLGGNVLNHNGEREIEIDGIKIIGIPHAKGLVQKSLNKINQSDFFKEMIRVGISLAAEVYHAHEPQSLYIAQQIAKKTDAKVIYDAHEPWINSPKKDAVLRKVLLPKLKFLISANQITRGDLLFHNHNLKSEVIYNCASSLVFPPEFNEEKLRNPIIVHEGSMRFDRGLKEIIEVVRLLKVDFPSIQLKIVGETYNDEKRYLEDKTKEYQLEQSIIETGWLAYEEVGNALKDCSIGLITNTNIEMNTLAGPANKFFNYLTYGIACISVDLPETTALLNETNSGITIQDRTIDNLYKGIESLLTNRNQLLNYCKNAFEAYHKFNWDIEERKLISFYTNVVLNKEGIHYR
ncbi:MAG: glycosyltransferase [Flavobacteriales bacterium]|nr:glycosyltransferase [Flavobacteriales bacterium]